MNFDEGERYIVALRNLKGEDGQTLAAPEGFRIYRDRVLTTNPDVESRREHFESLFGTLAEAGIDRDSLYRAWDFTVASERNLTERVLTIRDDAFAQLGDTNLADMKVEGEAPEFTIEEVTPNPEDQLALRVEGRYTVPCYLNLPNCTSGGTFSYPSGSTNGPPTIPEGSTTTARFQCNIPKSATTPGASRPSLYGHGLLGSRGEVNQGQLRDFGLEHNFIFCATDWVGMSCADLPDTDASPDAIASFLEKAQRGQLPNCDYQTVLGDSRGHVELPAARRPRAAGADQLPLPRAPDDPPRRLLERPELPGERPEPDRHPPALLRRQQPGRDHRRRTHRGRRRPRPRGPRRARG